MPAMIRLAPAVALPLPTTLATAWLQKEAVLDMLQVPDAVAAVWEMAWAVASDEEALADAWVMADTAIWLWPAEASVVSAEADDWALA
jgi:hypothetical protein